MSHSWLTSLNIGLSYQMEGIIAGGGGAGTAAAEAALQVRQQSQSQAEAASLTDNLLPDWNAAATDALSGPGLVPAPALPLGSAPGDALSTLLQCCCLFSPMLLVKSHYASWSRSMCLFH